jgi:hypothetical protein
MGRVHKLLVENGKQGVLQQGDIFERTVVEAAAGFLGDERDEAGFLFSGWAQAALPHRRLPDDQVWQVRTERVTLVVQPGFRVLDKGEPVPVGVPYGSRARLILLFLQSEAVRTKSREIELGKTLHAWLRRLEIPIGGRAVTAVRDQAERISRCRMSFTIKHGGRIGLVNQNLLDTAMFIEEDGPQSSLFIEKATLSQTFYDQLLAHPVPVKEAAVRQLANNSMALDVYCWLAWRLHALAAPTPITWKGLHAQFGRGIARQDHFKEHFRGVMQLALSVYPDAIVDESPQGVVLHPSRPPVAPRILAMVSSR